MCPIIAGFRQPVNSMYLLREKGRLIVGDGTSEGLSIIPGLRRSRLSLPYLGTRQAPVSGHELTGVGTGSFHPPQPSPINRLSHCCRAKLGEWMRDLVEWRIMWRK